MSKMRLNKRNKVCADQSPVHGSEEVGDRMLLKVSVTVLW